MLNLDVINNFKQQTIENAPEGDWKQFAWFVWRGIAYIGMALLVGVAVTLWFVFYVVFAAWRDPRG